MMNNTLTISRIFPYHTLCEIKEHIRKIYPCFKRCHYTYIIVVLNANFNRSPKLVYFYNFRKRKGQKIISDTSLSS